MKCLAEVHIGDGGKDYFIMRCGLQIDHIGSHEHRSVRMVNKRATTLLVMWEGDDTIPFGEVIELRAKKVR